MKTISLTPEERTLLLPLTKKRLAAWELEQTHDAGSRKRFERTYLLPLQKAMAKILIEIPASYTTMEKGILAGCIRENRDELRENKSIEELSAINQICKGLLTKLETRKTRLEVLS